MINFGVGGYNYDLMLATLRYRALSYEPDMVIFSITPHTRSYFFNLEEYKKPYQVPQKRNVFFKSYAKNRLFPYKSTQSEQGLCDEETEIRTSEIFRKLYELSNEYNFKVITLGLNSYPVLSRQQPFDLEESLSKLYGFHFIDTTPYFANYDYSILRINKTDEHPNALANSLFAEALYDGLNRFNLLNVNRRQ